VFDWVNSLRINPESKLDLTAATADY
jgi:hypothetical protein